MPSTRSLPPLRTTAFIFLFFPDGSREYFPVAERPNGWGDYIAAWNYIVSHPELPVEAGVGEVYTRG